MSTILIPVLKMRTLRFIKADVPDPAVILGQNGD